MIEDYKTKLTEAINLRETGHFEQSRKEFEELLEEVKSQLDETPTNEVKYFYATLMGEYVIQHRLESKDLLNKALELGEYLLKYDEENNIGNPLSIRAVSNTLIDLGDYGTAKIYLEMLLPLFKNNSAQHGDTLAHIARCHFSSGDILSAQKYVNQAIQEIETNSAKITDTSAWYSHALLLKSLIMNSNGEKELAIKQAQKALEVAKSTNKVIRIKQAKATIDYLNNN